MEEIIYGKSISSIDASDLSQLYISELYVKAVTPPTVNGIFTNKTYQNVKLYVPKESLTAYQAADVWKEFWNIEAVDFVSGISTPTVEKKSDVDIIYNLKGQRLSEPQRGLNIINGKKVIVK